MRAVDQPARPRRKGLHLDRSCATASTSHTDGHLSQHRPPSLRGCVIRRSICDVGLSPADVRHMIGETEVSAVRGRCRLLLRTGRSVVRRATKVTVSGSSMASGPHSTHASSHVACPTAPYPVRSLRTSYWAECSTCESDSSLPG